MVFLKQTVARLRLEAARCRTILALHTPSCNLGAKTRLFFVLVSVVLCFDDRH
jgi:hypothetical protein